MKQHIDAKQWQSLSPEEQQGMIPWLLGTGGLKEMHYSRYFTIGQCVEFIRQYHQLVIYTVDDQWCIQLFDLSQATNEEQNCDYETSGEELIDILWWAVELILEHARDY